MTEERRKSPGYALKNPDHSKHHVVGWHGQHQAGGGAQQYFTSINIHD